MMRSPELIRPSAVSLKLCHYRNTTSQLQIVRVLEGEKTLREHVLFPGETWLFEANLSTTLQIQTQADSGVMSKPTTCDRSRI